jgi:hypothetical protein
VATPREILGAGGAIPGAIPGAMPAEDSKTGSSFAFLRVRLSSLNETSGLAA